MLASAPTAQYRPSLLLTRTCQLQIIVLIREGSGKYLIWRVSEYWALLSSYFVIIILPEPSVEVWRHPLSCVLCLLHRGKSQVTRPLKVVCAGSPGDQPLPRRHPGQHLHHRRHLQVGSAVRLQEDCHEPFHDHSDMTISPPSISSWSAWPWRTSGCWWSSCLTPGCHSWTWRCQVGSLYQVTLSNDGSHLSRVVCISRPLRSLI